ncbi:MAG: ATP-binding protein [Desulfuromonadaceae bacterium]|nr:ATP-binding protein [Desulfuromonadaceae bacterium]
MHKAERFIIILPIFFTFLIGWFSWSAFKTAPQIAADSLRGTGLSIAAAIEELTNVKPAPDSLEFYSTPDIAYFYIVDRKGLVRFHTNSKFIGTVWSEPDTCICSSSGIYEERKTIATGESIYLLKTRIHPTGSNCLLTLALHTYRSDQIIRKTHTGIVVAALFTLILWLVTFGIMYLLRRDKQRQMEMQQLDEMARLGELGAVIAHEIRNPLAGIKGFVQLIETATDMEQARHYANKVVRQSLRMETLVDELLAFAHEDKLERQPTDLALLVQDCVEMIRMEADSRVKVIHTPHTAIHVMIISDRIIQLLLNLLKNGLQAMPDGGVLHVELQSDKSRAIIRIRDSGIGIPPENIPHIFEPFWTSKARGTGLGLALCRKVGREHGGSLTVESVVGIGTTFTMTLPLTD